MGRAGYAVCFLLSAAIAALAGGYLATILFILFAAGPAPALWPGLYIGFFGAVSGLKLATLPALVLGGLLRYFRITGGWIWAGTGAIAALGLYTSLTLFPAWTDEGDSALMFGFEWLAVAPAFMLAGAVAALLFHAMVQALTAYDRALRSG